MTLSRGGSGVFCSVRLVVTAGKSVAHTCVPPTYTTGLPALPTAPASMDAWLDRLSSRQLVGQLVVVGFAGAEVPAALVAVKVKVSLLRRPTAGVKLTSPALSMRQSGSAMRGPMSRATTPW